MRRLGARNDLSYEASRSYLMTVECHQTDTNSVRHTTEHDSKDAAISTHSYTVDERRMVRANAKDRIRLWNARCSNSKSIIWEYVVVLTLSILDRQQVK